MITFVKNKMARLKIREAVELYNSKLEEGAEPMTVTKLSTILYKDSESTARSKLVLMSALMTGKRRLIKTEWIFKLCDTLNVSPNFLFAYDDEHKKMF